MNLSEPHAYKKKLKNCLHRPIPSYELLRYKVKFYTFRTKSKFINIHMQMQFTKSKQTPAAVYFAGIDSKEK